MSNTIKYLLVLALFALSLCVEEESSKRPSMMESMKVEDLLATGKQVLIDVQKMRKFAELKKFAKGGMIIYYFDEQKQLRIYALPLDKPLIKFFDRIRRLKGKKNTLDVQETIRRGTA